MKRDSFIFYRSFMEALEDLSDKQYAKVFRAITKFAFNGEETALTGVEKVIFSLIKPQLIANQKRYENGCKGGRKPSEDIPKENQNKTESKPKLNQTQSTLKPNENDNENVNVNNNKKEESREEKRSSTLKDLDVSLQNFLNETGVMLDSYSINITEMDFDALSREFKNSSWLTKNITSFSKVCKIYPKIVSGYYRDFVDDEEVIIPQERWCRIEKILQDMKYNSENYSSYDDYDIHKAKQRALYDGLKPEEKAYFGDYGSFYNLLEYKSFENEKARFMRDFEKFVKKWRKKNVAS